MAIKHCAVSYYGLNYVEHAEQDFKEMIEHGCDEKRAAYLAKYRPRVKML